MDENNTQVPSEPTKKEKATQAGKDVAEVAAKAAGNYFGGPVGGKIVDKVASTKLGQNILNNAGKNLARNPVTKNALAKAQPAIEKSKPMLNVAAGSLGGNPSGSANAGIDASQSSKNIGNSNPSSSTSNAANNSGFGNGKSGLFPFSNKSSNKQDNSPLGKIGQDYKKAKKIIGIISALAPILLPIILGIIIIVIVMSQIMMVRDNITQLANQFTTGVEKFINFVGGEGLNTNEELFYERLNKEYNNFPYTGGSKLDVPLIAATVHYSTTIDLEQFEDPEFEDFGTGNEDGSPMIGALNKKQASAFYNHATNNLIGSVNTKVLGQKRLLGHLTSTKFKVGTYKFAEAAEYNKEFLVYASQVVISSLADVIDVSGLDFAISPISSFLKLHERLRYYVETTGDITYEMNYNFRNVLYDIEEILSQIGFDWNDNDSSTRAIEFDSKLAQTVNTQEEGTNGGMWPAIKMERTVNYGYDEYKQMKYDLYEIKAILKQSGIEYGDEKELSDIVKNTSNIELKTLYESYEKNKKAYMYSYTHYLQEVYIPFNYFYKQEYTQAEIDNAVDEIYDQKDFYYYLIDEESDEYCGGSCTYSVNGKEISNLKVRLLQCSDGNLGKPIPGEELVDFEKYILGVVYAEVGSGTRTEVAKVQAIAARSYALNRPKRMGGAAGLKLELENGNWILSIRNCVEDQVYCDPDKGCSSATKPTGYNAVTMYSGVNTKSNSYKGPLPEDASIRSAVAEVAGKLLLDKNGKVVYTPYTSVNQNKWASQAKDGMDYVEILLAEYESASSVSASNCSNVCNKATGDYRQWKQLASLGAPWANVVIGNGKTINQIGCLATSVAIQIARSGVPLQNINGEFNPGTFVEALKPNGFVTSSGRPGGTLFVWNSPTKVAPAFKYSTSRSLSGKTKAQKAATVQSLIDQGCYVVMEVKGNGGGEHYVAVDYVQGNEVYMMDPASTSDIAWNKYPHSWTSAAYCYKVSG